VKYLRLLEILGLRQTQTDHIETFNLLMAGIAYFGPDNGPALRFWCRVVGYTEYFSPFLGRPTRRYLARVLEELRQEEDFR